ncbi:epimerase family protein SDR39U1 homolog, chloroplastic isoform X7 [Zea mays]|uniref:epimerase family protein SDR39U1 homolog, chloroplastic isoform X7 n=1 Tax=Zea mays TaxID=4577 RepID=UPI001651F3E6|nr:uncharacterized protein LOC100383043 isoform X7 [Zea mays]
MGFPSTPNLKLEPRPRTRRLLRCALSSEPVPPMTVSITGATGFIGRRLVHKLLSDDHKVCILTRSASKAASVFPASTYPGLTIAQQGDWEACVRGSTAVVNLAGMPISTRWSPEIKQEIKQSRVNVTSKVCREWEATACQVNQEDVRLVLLRIGVVLGKDGGALAKMIPLFMMFAGGPLGTGRQWFSWIHLDDLVNLIYESLTNPTYKGVINGTAPNPVRLSELCERLGRIVGRPSWLPVPGFALKAVLGEGASVVRMDGELNYLVIPVVVVVVIGMVDLSQSAMNVVRLDTLHVNVVCALPLEV